MSVNSLRSPADHRQRTPILEPPSLSDHGSKDRRRVPVVSQPPWATKFVPQVGMLTWAADGTSLENGGQSAGGGSSGEGDMMVMMSDVDYVNGSPP